MWPLTVMGGTWGCVRLGFTAGFGQGTSNIRAVAIPLSHLRVHSHPWRYERWVNEDTVDAFSQNLWW